MQRRLPHLIVGIQTFAPLLLAGGAAVAVPGCTRTPPPRVEEPLRPIAVKPVAIPDGGTRHTERLAFSGWRGEDEFVACDRRTEALSERGQLSNCRVFRVPEGLAAPNGPDGSRPAVSDDPFAAARVTGDTSPTGAEPLPCRVALDDIPAGPAGPGAPAARATFCTPTGRLLLDEWRPPDEVDGDYFAIETSFSPSRRTLALLHLAVGIGDGDHTVEVVSVKLVPAPACR